MENNVLKRAIEISTLCNIPQEAAIEKLKQGFGPLHNAVSEDFRKVNPKTDEELLNWYKDTETYIWELTAYHLDPGFNYSGMCQGIGNSLKAKGVNSVLCLGDGVGDLTILLREQGLLSTYHDLGGSKTARFAIDRMHHFYNYTNYQVTETWAPIVVPGITYDAVVSLDFLEHVTNVQEWVSSIWHLLNPNGFFFAQNAFGIGSGVNGAMPMHLEINDRFEKDWDTLLSNVGFRQLASNWYEKL